MLGSTLGSKLGICLIKDAIAALPECKARQDIAHLLEEVPTFLPSRTQSNGRVLHGADQQTLWMKFYPLLLLLYVGKEQ